MKILHAAETIKGGVATVINSLTEYQTKQNGCEVICIVPSDQSENLIKIKNLKEIEFTRSGRSISGMLSFFWVLINTILKEKPDIVHLHSSFAGLLGRIAVLITGQRRKIRIIYCPHAFGFLMETSSFKKCIYSFAELLLAKCTDKIICVSQSEYNAAIKAGFKKEKLVVIHNGVKLKSKSNTFTANNKTHYKLLFVGRFDYQKGIDIFAQAMELLANNKATNITYEFTLIGEAVNSDSEINFQETDYIKVTQLGWLKPQQLEEQYLSHDALIIPSRWEGFAMVPLEAMSYGLPIIASNIDAFKEIDSAQNSFITFFELNPESLHAYLSNIHKIDLDNDSKLSLKKFESEYTVDAMNEKSFATYIN